MIYILLALLMLGLHWMYNRMKESQKKYIWYFACFAMWFLLAFRGERVGGDTIQYISSFEGLKTLSWEEIYPAFKKDTGFYYLLKLISLIWDNNVFFIALISLLSCIGIWVYIDRNTDKPILALFYYITLANFHFMITGMRQALAMSLCLLSLTFVEKKKPIPFFLLVIAAGLIHKSAFIFLINYFILRRKVNNTNMVVNVVAILIAVFSYESLLAYANEMLGYDYGVEQVSNGIIFYLILLAILLFVYMTHKKWLNNVKANIHVNMAIITTGMWTIRLFSRTIERLSMYWLGTIPITLIDSVEGFKGKQEYDYIRYGAILVAMLLFIRRSIGVTYYFCF